MYKRVVVFVAVVALVFSVIGTVSAAKRPAVVEQMLAKARQELTKATAEDVKASMDKKEKMVILDIRGVDEYEAGHIAGAINVPRGLLEFKVWKAIPDQNMKIYVHCRTGARATFATKRLLDLGYKNALWTPLHYAKWVKAGYPIER